MFAARDQENLVHGHQQVAASKPLNQSSRGLQPKTPGNRYPKTPLKVPLHDENAPGGFGGKSGKGKGLENMATGKTGATFDKNAFVTPMGPRTRAPLGMKTTNAKAKAFQTPAGPALEKELNSTQAPQTSTRRPKKVTHAESTKIAVHGDESPLAEREVEYAPPKPKDLPFESDVFPRGCLNYEALKPVNLMRGIHKQYHNEVDENGLTRMEREYEQAYQKSAKEGDERIMKIMEEDWTVGDVPETFRYMKKKPAAGRENIKPAVKKIVAPSNKGPATIASRRAASALSGVPKAGIPPPKTLKPKSTIPFLSRPKPAPPAPTNNNSTLAAAASRSTIGYTKGRSASTTLGLKKREGGMTRSVSNLSQGSDSTITPARYAEKGDPEYRRPDFLGAFDVDEDLQLGLRDALPECLRRYEEDEEEFVMTLGSE